MIPESSFATAPECNGSSTANLPADADAIIDRVHLDRQTMGDAAIAREVLELFRIQAEDAAGRLDSSSAEQRRFLAHGLRGSASGIGAFTVARAAAAVETHPDDGSRLGALSDAISAACAHIRTYGA